MSISAVVSPVFPPSRLVNRNPHRLAPHPFVYPSTKTHCARLRDAKQGSPAPDTIAFAREISSFSSPARSGPNKTQPRAGPSLSFWQLRHCRLSAVKPACQITITRCGGKRQTLRRPLHGKDRQTPRLSSNNARAQTPSHRRTGSASLAEALQYASGPVQSSTWHAPRPQCFRPFGGAPATKSRYLRVSIVYSWHLIRRAAIARKNDAAVFGLPNGKKNPRRRHKSFLSPRDPFN